eukprot:CAMPEP_0113937006 /NCGR_PEP_ID=MMETSP1339-20121228/3724_1 /TAXON_ID=94617 /ORGANISM="Fibrocapsa japonica" /LENGTH=421 /DNA_ID=CAMNT_0000939609 /DNA_START=56 /DNA_END=1321 /DNA_ORIENTATION=+ /assembly_acc=CAM_ASM_000762
MKIQSLSRQLNHAALTGFLGVGLMLSWALFRYSGTNFAEFAKASNPTYVYIGSYTDEVEGIMSGSDHSGKGIYSLQLNEDGTLSRIGQLAVGKNPTFLTLHPSKSFLYAANELGSSEPGTIYSLKISPESGSLAIVNVRVCPGYNPSSIDVDPEGQFLAASFFLGGGGVASFWLNADGSIGETADLVTWTAPPGSPLEGVTSQVHAVGFARHTDLLFALDIALGYVVTLALDRSTGRLTRTFTLELPVDWGVRSLAFADQSAVAPGSEWRAMYISLQSASGLATVLYNSVTGETKLAQRVSYEAECVAGATIAAADQYVMQACRRDSSVRVSLIDKESGLISGHATTIPAVGSNDRGFAAFIDEAGILTAVVGYLSADLTATFKAKDVLDAKSDLKSGLEYDLTEAMYLGSPAYVVIKRKT